VRVPWYRSLPLSCLEALEVSVDGQPVDGVTLQVNGHSYTPSEWVTKADEFWFVQDTAFVPVPAAGLGDQAQVAVRAAWRIPYLILGDRAMVRTVTDSLALPVEGR